jgi:hypothetical protein
MQLMAQFCLAYKMMLRDDFGQAGSYGIAEFTQQLDYLIKSRNGQITLDTELCSQSLISSSEHCSQFRKMQFRNYDNSFLLISNIGVWGW